MMYRNDVIAGIGYGDGLVRETIRPKLWKYWDTRQKLVYLKYFYTGWYFNWQQSMKRILR